MTVKNDDFHLFSDLYIDILGIGKLREYTADKSIMKITDSWSLRLDYSSILCFSGIKNCIKVFVFAHF